MSEPKRAAAKLFIDGIKAGRIDPSLMADTIIFWSAGAGVIPAEQWLGALAAMASLFPDGLDQWIVATTIEDDRAAVQAQSRGTLRSGADYANEYHYLLRFDESDRLIEVREYMDTALVQRMILPELSALLTQPG